MAMRKADGMLAVLCGTKGEKVSSQEELNSFRFILASLTGVIHTSSRAGAHALHPERTGFPENPGWMGPSLHLRGRASGPESAYLLSPAGRQREGITPVPRPEPFSVRGWLTAS